MTRARPAAVVTLVLCGVLAGCTAPGATTVGDASKPSATPSADQPASFSGALFATVVPATWSNKTSDVAEVARFTASGNKVEFLIEHGPPGRAKQNVNDVTANINVLLLPSPVPDDQLGLYLQTVSSNGASNLSDLRPITVGGAVGQMITYGRDIQGTPGESEDMVVNHAGNTYDIVLNTSRYAFPLQLPALQSVLTQWHWVG